MNVLLNGGAAKSREKKKKPSLGIDEEKDFVLFDEKDLEENRQDSFQSPAEEEERWKGFGDFFAKPESQTTHVQSNRFGSGVESKTERKPETANNGKYIPPLQMANIQRSNDIYERYKAGEEWLMSEGDDLAKGFINRFRSAPGEAIEDLSYFLYDLIPEDADGKLMRWLRNNAGKVVENNTAGQIGTKADEQFNSAKEVTGYLGDRLIDAADATASMLSYGTFFGPSNLALSQSIGGGMDEYRNQRENGADVSEALTRGGLAGITSYVIERFGGLGADNSSAPKIKLTDITSILNAIVRTATQEGKEEMIEYTANSFTDAIVDAVYRGKISFDWNIEDAVNQAITGAMVGGELEVSPTVNGRDIDIVDEMNKIISESADIETRVNNTKNLQNRLKNRKKAKQELDKLLYYLQDEKTKGVNGIIRNAWGKPVIEVGRSTVFGAPNSITQKINANGGVVRNYYNSNKEQCKQIANNNENHRKNNFDRGGIHAHDYSLNDKKIPNHKSARAMNTWEILENGDILWKLLN